MQVSNSFKIDHCPLCQSRDICQMGKLDYRGKVNFSTHEIELGYFPELWKCEQCQSCFVQRTLTEDTAKMLYSTGQAGERWSKKAFDQNKTRDVIDSMAAIFKSKGSVLDVGCNTGVLLDFAHGIGCKTSGVEFSSASRKIIVEKGHTAYSTFEETTGEYDVITGFDLVEHLYHVPIFLKGCHTKEDFLRNCADFSRSVNILISKREIRKLANG